MAKKTTSKSTAAKTPKRYGVMVRVSEEFAAALREAAAEEMLSAAEFCNARLLPVVRKYRDEAVLRKARAIEKRSSKAAGEPPQP